MNSFYADVISNSNYQYNTLCNFRNKIDLLYPLDGQWEVALVETCYTKSWKNLSTDSVISVEYMFDDPMPFISLANTFGYAPFKDEDRKGIVRAGYYDSISILCEEIEKEMIPFKSGGKIKYLPELYCDDITRKVVIKPGEDTDGKPLLPSFPRELAGLLGFDWYSTKHPNYNEEHLVLGNRAADITAGIRKIMVYCNLIVPQYVGDTRTKLLKSVEIPNNSKFGDQINIKEPYPQYVDLLVNDFEEIEIDIKDDTNAPIRFMTGKTSVKLHFRKCQTLT